MAPEKIAENVWKEIDNLCKKYNCEIGVWLNWRDLQYNFDQMKNDPKLNELKFGLEVRIHGKEADNTMSQNDKG